MWPEEEGRAVVWLECTCVCRRAGSAAVHKQAATTHNPHGTANTAPTHSPLRLEVGLRLGGTSAPGSLAAMGCVKLYLRVDTKAPSLRACVRVRECVHCVRCACMCVCARHSCLCSCVSCVRVSVCGRGCAGEEACASMRVCVVRGARGVATQLTGRPSSS
jgi:hypothetical protein